MRIVQVVTDYIMKSIMTTHGDLVVRGAAIPERLAAVALGQVLKSAGVGAKPAWGRPSIGNMNVASGTFTRNSAGDEVINIGFSAKLCFFMAYDDTAANINMSWGFDDGDTIHRCMGLAEDGAARISSTVNPIYVKRSAGNLLVGVISAIVSPNLTITFTLTGAVTLNVIYLALG